jgi:hypothetical protein
MSFGFTSSAAKRPKREPACASSASSGGRGTSSASSAASGPKKVVWYYRASGDISAARAATWQRNLSSLGVAEIRPLGSLPPSARVGPLAGACSAAAGGGQEGQSWTPGPLPDGAVVVVLSKARDDPSLHAPFDGCVTSQCMCGPGPKDDSGHVWAPHPRETMQATDLWLQRTAETPDTANHRKPRFLPAGAPCPMCPMPLLSAG